MRELVAGQTAFALDFYAAVRATEGNLFFSPYSLSTALAMPLAGARGRTEHEMNAALHLTLPRERLHAAMRALAERLGVSAEPPAGAEPAQTQPSDTLQLHVANALWGQADYQFLPDYLAFLNENYGAGLRLANFAANPEEARAEMNSWVAAQTAKRIQEIIPAGVLQPDTKLVLTNAIYFKAAWAHQFEPEATHNRAFELLSGARATVPMMIETEHLLYHNGEGFTAVELPYLPQRFACLLLVPDLHLLDAFEKRLDTQLLASVVSRLRPERVELVLPKFTFESEFRLGKTLADMGMPTAFRNGADFSGIDGTRKLYLDEVLHKAFVAVDETGTEAAAATAAVMRATAVPPQPIHVVVDRPFLFVIRERDTGAVLFLGRVMDPR